MKTKEEQRYELVKEWLPSILDTFVKLGEPLDGKVVVNQTIMMAEYAVGKLSDLAPKKETKTKKVTSTSKPFLDRVKDFRAEVDTFSNLYSKALLDRFFDYWSEKVQDEDKMRCEVRETWQTSMRLKYFATHNKYSNVESPKKDTEYENFKRRYEKD